ncbi:MAG: biopolymer transporter ExbD [bacterium]
MNFRGRHQPNPIAFQIAPMVDFLLVLLCYSIMSQIFTQWEAELDVKLPTASSAQIEQRLPGEIILNIMKNGTTIVNGRTLSDPELASLLRRLVDLFPGQPVLLRADKQTDYEHVIKVLDFCRQADIWNVSFATGLVDKKAGS